MAHVVRPVAGLQGQQWVRMVVLGQSFMLHQIRKLVGTAVAVMRGDAPPDCIALALQPERSVVRLHHSFIILPSTHFPVICPSSPVEQVLCIAAAHLQHALQLALSRGFLATLMKALFCR